MKPSQRSFFMTALLPRLCASRNGGGAQFSLSRPSATLVSLRVGRIFFEGMEDKSSHKNRSGA